MVVDDDVVEDERGARIKVIGVGGGGGNAVNTMIAAGLPGVDFIAANTDAQALRANLAPIKLQLGEKLTRGLGAGGNPEVGKRAAQEDVERLARASRAAPTWSSSPPAWAAAPAPARAPVVAKVASELGCAHRRRGDQAVHLRGQAAHRSRPRRVCAS